MKRKNYFFHIFFITIIFWVVSGIIIFSVFKEILNVQAENSQTVMAKTYVETAFPIISRGGNDNIRSDIESSDDKSDLFKGMFSGIFPEISAIDDFEGESEDVSAQPNTLTPTNNLLNNDQNNSANKNNNNQAKVIPKTIVSAEKPQKTNLSLDKPTVIIYHTHATESYKPVINGNFHSLNESGTVREVGNVLASSLEAQKIKVLHDKTMHDYPSYNQSYIRSLDTIKRLSGKYKSAKIIIDLHRDAAEDKKPDTVTINGKKAATFTIVIGDKNPNARQLNAFANYIMKKSNAKYPGIMRGIINKPYKFNEYLSDYYILLEIGNNENDIKQATLTAQYVANILSDVIDDIKK